MIMGAMKNSSKKTRFVGIPYNIVNSDQWAKLKAAEVKLLLDLLLQYHGRNNGSLSPCYSLMKKRGWARSSLYRAYSRLVHSGYIVVTRQGWKVRGRPTLVALTWYGIDEPNKCHYDGNIDAHPVPLNYWRKRKSDWKHKPSIKKI